MRKIIITLIILLLGVYSSMLCAQNEPEGEYYSEYGVSFKIEKSKFVLIANYPGSNYSTYIAAEGNVKRINQSFLELNSFDTPAERMHDCVKMHERSDTLSTDSITVRFNIPYFERDNYLRIDVYLNFFMGERLFTGNNFEFKYTEKLQEIKIPREGVEYISFSIVLGHPPYSPIAFDDNSYGILSVYSYWDYPVKSNTTYVEFDIPIMDNLFFKQYYMKGEYVHIVGNSIFWKGVEYKKKQGR